MKPKYAPSALAFVLLSGFIQFSGLHAMTITSTPSMETESVVVFTLTRDCGRSDLENIAYRTEDITAMAGRDYLSSTGMVTFAIGERTKPIAVPILDNALPDGDRTFQLVVTHLGPGEDCPVSQDEYVCCGSVGVIGDNELTPWIDYAFRDPFEGWPSVRRFWLSDGRMLWDTRVLRPDGALAFDLLPLIFTIADSAEPLAVLPDDTVLFRIWRAFTDQWRLAFVRPIEPGGRIESVADFHPPFPLPHEVTFLAAQPDGRAVFLSRANETPTQSVVYRVTRDGALDPSFLPLRRDFQSVAIQPDGRLLAVENSPPGHVPENEQSLVRLNPDGSEDPTFAPSFSRSEGLPVHFAITFPRLDGRTLVVGGFDSVNGVRRSSVVQLTKDGLVDPTFPPSGSDSLAPYVVAEHASRALVMGGYREPFPMQAASLQRYNPDGSVDTLLNSVLPPPRGMNYPPSLEVTPGQDVLFGGYLRISGTIDGTTQRTRPASYRRVRLLTRPLTQFCVFAPTELRSSDMPSQIEIQVARTGESSAEAGVRYSTRDGTARAGLDYTAASGRLTFAPLEVSKSFQVWVSRRSSISGPLDFYVDLTEPSPGYTVATAKRVLLDPGLPLPPRPPRLLEPRYQTGPGSARIVLRFVEAEPHVTYRVEGSRDLKRWSTVSDVQSRGTAASADIFVGGDGSPPLLPRFFRVTAP